MLSVKEKSMLAEYVRENNLHRTNVMSKEVYPKEGIYSKYIKRILDIIVSLVVLIITCPVNICIGICTYLMLANLSSTYKNDLARMGNVLRW